MDRSAVSSASEQDLVRLGLSERGDMICVKSFCAPANLEKQKAALVDKISSVRREGIAKRSRRSKSVSTGWMHYGSVKKKYVHVTEAKGGGVRQCIFQNETPEEEILFKAKDIFLVIKGHYTEQRMI